MFVVPKQRGELIVGSNVIRPIIQNMKLTDKYWELISSTYLERAVSPAAELFLPVVGARTGTMRLREAITLLPQHEYGVVWGKLPALSPVLLGSTVMVEPTSACSTPKNILVGRIVTLMLGDCWIPVKC